MRPYLYLPFWQFAPQEFAIAVRSASEPALLANAVKTEIWRIDKDQPVTDVATMKQVVSDAIAPRRFQAILMTLFAAFALVLAAIGIHGVLSYSVAQRTQEIGIRMALGARPVDVRGLVIREALILALVGVVIGLVGALAGSRLLESLLYQVDPRDPLTLATTAALLVLLAICASVAPARRASQQDPARTLRAQ